MRTMKDREFPERITRCLTLTLFTLLDFTSITSPYNHKIKSREKNITETWPVTIQTCLESNCIATTPQPLAKHYSHFSFYFSSRESFMWLCVYHLCSIKCVSSQQTGAHTHIHTRVITTTLNTHTFTYLKDHMQLCVCVCVWTIWPAGHRGNKLERVGGQQLFH